MARMFYRCSSLTSLDLSNFNTYNVKDMGDMFNGCNSLASLDVHNFNTANVTTMTNMFCGCSSLKSLDLSSFIVNIVIYGLFKDCSSLRTIYAGNWNAGDSYCDPAPFSGCSNLKGGQGTKVGQNFMVMMRMEILYIKLVNHTEQFMPVQTAAKTGQDYLK